MYTHSYYTVKHFCMRVIHTTTTTTILPLLYHDHLLVYKIFLFLPFNIINVSRNKTSIFFANCTKNSIFFLSKNCVYLSVVKKKKLLKIKKFKNTYEIY